MASDISPALLTDRFVELVESDKIRITSGNTLAVLDNGFEIQDNADPTKIATFQASGITAATTRVMTVPDRDMNLGSSAGQLRTVVDTGGAFATPIVLTLADSGKIYLLDDAAGLDFTLPALTAAEVGIQYTFFVQTATSSNSYRFTAQAADLLIGHIFMVDKDVAEGSTEALISSFRPDGTDDLIITISGSTTAGGLPGGWFDITAISATRWFVRGLLVGDDALATVFS